MSDDFEPQPGWYHLHGPERILEAWVETFSAVDDGLGGKEWFALFEVDGTTQQLRVQELCTCCPLLIEIRLALADIELQKLEERLERD